MCPTTADALFAAAERRNRHAEHTHTERRARAPGRCFDLMTRSLHAYIHMRRSGLAMGLVTFST